MPVLKPYVVGMCQYVEQFARITPRHLEAHAAHAIRNLAAVMLGENMPLEPDPRLGHDAPKRLGPVHTEERGGESQAGRCFRATTGQSLPRLIFVEPEMVA